MQRLYFIGLIIIIFLSAPEIGNSSVRATNLNNWGDLNSTLKLYLNLQNGLHLKKIEKSWVINPLSLQ
tara:strand:+ start:204 stop:407 length:204 start_codon:yes stop_codon:yes gene_type:complete